MANTNIHSRLLSFPAPACRCGGALAETGQHEANCLFGLLLDAAAEMDRLRAENTRLLAMTVSGAPGQTRVGDRYVWVRLMCYWGKDGVWNSDDERADAAPVALSPGLRDEIVAWKHSLDKAETVSISDIHAFSTRAMNIARRIKEEMPSWRVVYIDRTKSGADIRNKDYFEHEVTL
ncbi:hypothetical protein A6A04_18635 [Paramagnetospirillum marisnigri]|uniref:Uncharacterized protein n=1 Tax=Paramagnetospirillum marisnigri TaxID=1285242 RepID=A0A178MM96_9PROT|nr:hypothetical protein [Paramagnetospirillum marisnigri]OAN49880.1 hypothetical protein A6A04_18635 [Paramagnetospirillum marisnigri]